MKARKLGAWFMWGSLVGFGIVLPLSIGQNPENELLVQLLRLIGCAGFVVGLVSLFRSSGVSTVAASAVDEEAVVPRTLCNNPLAAAHGSMPLAQRIDMAVEASSAYGRSFGVIYYDLNSYRRIARSHGVAAAEVALEFVLGILQMMLRNTDRAEPVGGGRFVVCLPLLPDHETLQSVRERAAQAMGKMRIQAMQGDPIEFDSGVAIYPIHGKCGADLIAHAQRECEAARERRLREAAPHAAPALQAARKCAA